jgi:helicase
MSVPELGYPQTLTNRMSLLARQIQWGAPVEAIDMIRLAHRERVPGFGRQRAMALLHQGIQTFDQLLVTAQEKLTTLLGHQSRVRSLLQAVGSCFALGSDKFQKIHSEIAAKLGLTEIVDACTTDLGENYERAIMKLLKAEKSWDVRLLDDGKLQNVVDILVVLSNTSVLIECKTTTKKPPVIKKEEAFAVMQKAADFEPSAKRVTLGKPAFDEHSKGKVLAATSVSLVEHNVFMEGMLRVLLREVTPKQFLDWLGEPGLTELDRLPGRPSYQLIIDQPEQQAA